jgi:hypothetical protein
MDKLSGIERDHAPSIVPSDDPTWT